ncbi:hypothetical protein M5K25_017316 [Dendrobium thyrsiflorum]|uniref:Reverse transcriptase zinc-binding domain-containing protein n=1 Tax=Dendrobium thyrsiflorum TaxID=117978 RepID=A0ABD0UU53_DENTH
MYVEEFYSELPKVAWASSIWHKRHVLKFLVFGWMAVASGLKTVDALFKRNIPIDARCFLCHSCNETIGHLFFECPFSFSIISELIPGSSSLLLRPTLTQIMYANGKRGMSCWTCCECSDSDYMNAFDCAGRASFGLLVQGTMMLALLAFPSDGHFLGNQGKLCERYLTEP